VTLPVAPKILSDQNLRLTSNTTLQGAAQNKGTATDLLLVVLAAGDGANALAGTETVTLQGANATSGPWTTVVADKGTLNNITSGVTQQVVHAAQLQFQFYRVALSAGAATTCDVSTCFIFMPVEDTFDSSQQ
jgi:hypothetical protein